MKKKTKFAALMSFVALIALVSTVAISAMAEDITASKTQSGEVISQSPETEKNFPVGIEQDSQLSVSVDDYAFGEGKVLCVKVNNLDDDAYGITIKVIYYSADGEILGEEAQYYDQLVKGYEKNFVFITDYDFADYYIQTEKTVYDGDCWKTDMAINFGGFLKSYGDHYINGEKLSAYKLHPAYVGYNNCDAAVIVNEVKMVIFDNNGEVVDVLTRGGEVFFGVSSEGNYKHFPELVFPINDEQAQAEYQNLSNATAFISYSVIPEEESIYAHFIVE